MSDHDTPPLPPGWVEASLERFCLIIQGQSPPSRTYNSTGEGLPFFQGKAEFGELYPSPIKWCSCPTKVAERDDILISVRAPVGPTNLCPGTACIGRGLAAIRPLGGVHHKYILYGLRATERELAAKGTGSTFSAISGRDLRRHTLPLAPLAEQRRIVAEIEKHFTRLDAAVAALERARANLKRYRAAVLKAACEGRLVPTEAELARAEGRDYETGEQLLQRILQERRAKWEAEELAKLRAKGKEPKDDRWKAKYKEPAPPDTSDLPELPEGWVWARLDQLLGSLRNGISKKPDSESGTPILRINAVRPLSVNMEEIRYLSGSVDQYADYVLCQGDLLFTRYNGSPELVGVCGAVRAVDRKVVYPDKLIRARLASHLCLSSFVQIVLNVGLSREFIARRIRTTAGQSGVSGSDIRSVPLPLPPLAEQQRIVAEVERRLSVVEELERQVEASLKRAARLRQAILRRAFAGKLVPQDPNDEPGSVLLDRIRAERAAAAAGEPKRRRSRRTSKNGTRSEPAAQTLPLIEAGVDR